MEWNVKITTKEVSHIIDKFQKTFDTYWQSDEFELYDDSTHSEKLVTSLKHGNTSKAIDVNYSFFEIKPYPFQLEILETLEVERSLHHRYRNLVVAATGTGKTIISAFDYKRFRQSNQSSNLLFLAHRKEILKQALDTYRGILRDNNFGELWVDGLEPTNRGYVFASVQTLNNRIDSFELSDGYYDYIVIDECHHLTANSYRSIINSFQPRVRVQLLKIFTTRISSSSKT